jgi:hypothetical protein
VIVSDDANLGVAVLILQESHKDFFDLQPDFRHIFTPVIVHSPCREPRYEPVYADNRQNWTFYFVLALFNEFTEE